MIRPKKRNKNKNKNKYKKKTIIFSSSNIDFLERFEKTKFKRVSFQVAAILKRLTIRDNHLF